MEMDPDVALGMLKTISTFLDFFATINFLKNSFKFYNFWIFESPAKTWFNCTLTLEVFFSDFTTDFVVMWEHNWPFVQGTGVQISLEPNFFFPYIDKNFQMKAIFTSLWYSKVGNIWFLSPLVLSKWEDLAFSVCIIFEKRVFIFQFLNDGMHNYVKHNCFSLKNWKINTLSSKSIQNKQS